MNALAEMKCVPCRGDEPSLTEEEIADLKPKVPKWQVVNQQGVKKLHRNFKFEDFAQALDFTNRVGDIAEEQGHHPVLITKWGEVTVSWWTHEIEGLHNNDFVMAAKTDQLYESE